MTQNESFDLTARISKLISEKNPVISYTDADIKQDRKEYSKKDLHVMRDLGLYDGDFEKYFVLRKFCREYGISEQESPAFLRALFGNARHLDADLFEADPYIRAVRFPPVREGNITFAYAEYRRGEILLYDEPDLDSNLIVPKLGFFSRQVRFPSVYEETMPWMSVCPSEINSMQNQIAAAHGRVLVLGLGLGYYPFMAAENPAVSDILIVERNPVILRLFQTHLLPQFPKRAKIRFLLADAVEYVQTLSDGAFDFCFADIWEGILDGAPLYQKIKKEESRLPHTLFTYWIEPQLRFYLKSC